MAHVTFCADSMSELQQRVAPFGLLDSTCVSSSNDNNSSSSSSAKDSNSASSSSKKPLPAVGIIMGRYIPL
jgi:hypothetical protein